MISSYLMGGLGNQLFQIFNCIAYGIENNVPFIFQYSDVSPSSVFRTTYWETFLSDIKQYTTKVISKYRFSVYKESFFRYREHPKNIENIYFNGYFQSYKYFESCKNKIFDMIHLREQQENCVAEYPEYFVNENTISLHFRLGDYKSKQEYHPLQKYEYYKKAFNILSPSDLSKYTVLYFCEKEDNSIVENTINELKKDFVFHKITKVDDNIPDWKQMLIMSCCNMNIIANSSFSWWGAYFNKNKDNIVIYPSLWFGPAIGHNDIQDLCPDDWIKVSV